MTWTSFAIVLIRQQILSSILLCLNFLHCCYNFWAVYLAKFSDLWLGLFVISELVILFVFAWFWLYLHFIWMIDCSDIMFGSVFSSWINYICSSGHIGFLMLPKGERNKLEKSRKIKSQISEKLGIISKRKGELGMSERTNRICICFFYSRFCHHQKGGDCRSKASRSFWWCQ